MELLVSKRRSYYRDIVDIWSTGVSKYSLERLAHADVFNSIGLERRKALWEVMSLADKPVPILASQTGEGIEEKKIVLPQMQASEHVVQDYASTSLSLKAHPVSFVREKLSRLKIVQAAELKNLRDGRTVKVAGLVLVRQRPGTAVGVCFMTIEDETGVANLVIFKNLFDEFRKEILGSRLIMAEGTLQIEGEVIHVIVKNLF